MKRQLTITIIFLLTYYVMIGQGISTRLDSIHQLTGTDYEKIELYHILLNNWEKEKNYTQYGYDAHQLAKWIHREKKWEEAINIIQKAYQAREKVIPLNKKLLKSSYHNYAAYNYRYQKYSKGIEYFEKLLSVDDSIFLRARAYETIGKCYEILGDFYKSIEYQKKALPNHLKKDIEKGAIVRGHINIAYAYYKIRSAKSSELGIEHLQEAERLFKKQEYLGKSNLANIKKLLGNFYYEGVGTKNLDKCITSYNECLQILKETNNIGELTGIHYNLGLAYTEIDSSKASNHFNQAINHAEHYPSLKPLINMGIGLKEFHYKDYQKAQSHFSQSLAQYFNREKTDIYWLPKKENLKKISNPPKFLELLKAKLKNWIAQAKEEENPQYYTEAIKTAYICDAFVNLSLEKDFSDRTKLLWRDLSFQTYIIVLEACLQLERYDDAFYFMEKSKALLLLQDIRKNDFKLPPVILERNMELKNKVASLRTQVMSANQTNLDSLEKLVLSSEAQLKNYQDSLSPQYPEYFANYSIPKTIPLSTIQLDTTEAILEYNMGIRLSGVKPEAYGLFITNTNKELFKITEVDQLKKNIFKLRKLLNKPFRTKEDVNSYHQLSYAIYSSLFPKSIQDQIKNKKLTIIPDNILNYIPFEALITNESDKTYLIEKTQIHYTHSISFDKTNTDIHRNASFDFLGVAPIKFSDNLSALPKSKIELSDANQYYNGDLLFNDEATKENFKEKINNYKIIHLATHADASDSLNPWIALQDKKLHHLELNALKTNADLVVLSACNTSIGEVRPGEGVLSLARGFFKSGANTVIPSLWSTNDKATATITSDFYKNLSEGQTKSAALRSAKLNYLKNNTDAEASPHYWASLVLIGDNGTLLPTTNYWIFLWIGLGIVTIVLIVYRFVTYRNNIS